MTPTSRRQWFFVGAICAGLGLGAWALTRYGTPPEGVRLGQRAPDFRVLRLGTGDSVGVRSAYAGKVTLVNIWATWCGPCREEMPSMERAYQAYRDRGFAIAAVSVDEGDSALVRSFATRFGFTFDILHDRGGGIQQVYRTIGVPQSVLLDRSGRVAYSTLGPEAWDSPASRARIEQLLAKSD